jgi:NifU-like protein involved in Fe-S cluster formation
MAPFDDPHEFDRFVEEMQQMINEQDEKEFTPEVLQHAKNPYHMGTLDQPEITFAYTGPCHDTIELDLQIAPGTPSMIQTGRFRTDGCGPTFACGSVLMQLIEGLSLEKAEQLSEADLLRTLKALPPTHEHCATLAIRTLKGAIKKYKTAQNMR